MSVINVFSRLFCLSGMLALIACAPLLANSDSLSSSAQAEERSSFERKAFDFPPAMSLHPPADLPATPVDRALDGKAWSVTKLDSSLIQQRRAELGTAEAKSDGNYTLQFEAVGDFDAAQKRRWALQSRSGYTLSLVFDSPFYKIRGGSFSKKGDAEDAVRRLQDAGVTAFVIKLK